MSLKNFEVVARPLPTAAVPNPAAIRVQVFAPDEVIAKSKFWTVARRIARLKKSHGEVLAVQQVIEPEPTRVKNYGIWLTFRSTRATHNIYKEYRDTTTEGAVLQLYQEMAGTHNVKSDAISIIRIAEIASDDVVHPTIKQFTHDGIKYPITKQLIRPAHPSQARLFSRKRPTVCGF
jgi:large subunit ribosomal protein L18Ae